MVSTVELLAPLSDAAAAVLGPLGDAAAAVLGPLGDATAAVLAPLGDAGAAILRRENLHAIRRLLKRFCAKSLARSERAPATDDSMAIQFTHWQKHTLARLRVSLWSY